MALLTLVNEEHPDSFKVTNSGWVGWYHVIYESPEEGDLHFEHKFVSEKELIDMVSTHKKEIAEFIKVCKEE